MLAVLSVEIRKLNRSLAALLAVAAPSLIAVFVFFNMLRGKAPMAWEMWMTSAMGIWAFFMLPMSVTALTALVAHMEHGPRSWDHLRALPVARWIEYQTGVPYIEEIITEPFTLDADGLLRMPTGPGLGITLNREAIARFSAK